MSENEKRPPRLPILAPSGFVVALMVPEGLQLWDKRTKSWALIPLAQLEQIHQECLEAEEEKKIA